MSGAQGKLLRQPVLAEFVSWRERVQNENDHIDRDYYCDHREIRQSAGRVASGVVSILKTHNSIVSVPRLNGGVRG